MTRNGYIPVFEGDKMSIYDSRNTKITVSRAAVLEGWYVPHEKLWRIPLVKNVTNIMKQTVTVTKSPVQLLQEGPPPPTDKALSAYELKTKPELIRYFHAAAGFPTKPTWVKAIKNGHFETWPGLTWEAAAKHFPESIETWRGHGRKIQMNLRSTKQAVQEENDSYILTKTGAGDKENAEPNTSRPAYQAKKCLLSRKLEGESVFIPNLTPFAETQSNEIYHKIYDLHEDLDRRMYTDQTGRFPVKSYRGMQYIMVLIELDSNSILVEPMRDRTSGEMIQAYQVLVDRLKSKGFKPNMHILDNECSAEFKEKILENEMEYQLVPPHDHRRNIAEKAIQVFKDHFVSVLCGTDDKFPLKLWCRILRQAEHQLNMLRISRVDPSKSSFEIMNGSHDYNANPFAPLGCKVEIHVVPNKRKNIGSTH